MVTCFKNRLENGQFVHGPFMKTGDPAFVETAGHAGFEFVVLDMEHGPTDFLNLQNLIRAAECSGVLPVVRVSKLDEVMIARALDVGAKAVQIPQIESADEAERAVKFAKYAPEGTRGVCRYVRAANYSATERHEYFAEANRNLVILQLEGQTAIKNVDSILEVSGIDIVFLGPNDLAQSLGVLGETEHPVVEENMRIIVEKARSKGIAVGTFVDSPQMAEKWQRLNVQYISCSVDVGIFYEACKKIREEFWSPQS